MKKENLHKPFEVVYQELDESPSLQEHEHSFFELVYIVSGSGLQCINNNVFDYHNGHLFLITPQDCHSFDVKETTKFFFIKFNDIYIKSNMLHSDNIQRLEFILDNANHKPGCILRNQSDKNLVRPLIEAILREHINKDLYNHELITQLVNTLIIVVARNIAKILPEKVNSCSEARTLDILQYIQSNIYYPEKLRAKTVANHFGISEFYLGRYFKKHTNETMQQYIINYRLKLIEARLLFSDLRINEIAFELGFTDESHMNKLFRKYRGISPSEFRQKNKVESLG
jgi:AraC-type DNA-binding domain-containing proteins